MATPPSWTSSIHPEWHPSILKIIHPSWTVLHPVTRGWCSLTCCDVKLVADGETPHSPPDTGRKSLPPQFPDPPRSLPTHTNTKINTHAAIRMGQRGDCRHTWHPNEVISRRSRSPWRWRCCPHVGVAPSSDASSSELLSSLKRCRRTGWCLKHDQNLREELCLTSPLGSCHHLLILHLVSQSFLHRFGWQVPKGHTGTQWWSCNFLSKKTALLTLVGPPGWELWWTGAQTPDSSSFQLLSGWQWDTKRHLHPSPSPGLHLVDTKDRGAFLEPEGVLQTCELVEMFHLISIIFFTNLQII